MKINVYDIRYQIKDITAEISISQFKCFFNGEWKTGIRKDTKDCSGIC